MSWRVMLCWLCAMRLLRLLRSQLVFAIVAGATMLMGCSSLPQGLLLPDLPASENGGARGPQTVRHGAEGQSSQRSLIWGAAEGGQRQNSPADQAGRPGPHTILAEAGSDGITLNLVDATIADAAKAVLGDILKVNYIIDSRVKGSVTVQTTRPVTQQAILDIFDVVLSGQGARIVANQNLYRIVPSSDAPAGAP